MIPEILAALKEPRECGFSGRRHGRRDILSGITLHAYSKLIIFALLQ